MPIHIPPVSRRHFLTGTLATSVGMLLPGRSLHAADDQINAARVDVNRWTLMADIHIWEHRDRVAGKVKPAENFEAARQRILAAKTKPAAVIVAGDCVYLTGQKADYAVLADIVRPYREAGIPLHMALGNHDNRGNFLEAFPEAKTRDQSSGSPKHVSIIKSPHADFFLLDSLQKTDHTPGRLGESQLQWLAAALDTGADKPAILVMHHQPDRNPETQGLRDTKELYEVILPRKQVKACVFGHTHRWNIDNVEGLYLVNLPTLAWIFDKKEPIGWVDATLRPDGMSLTLNALSEKHPAHGRISDLAWRK